MMKLKSLHCRFTAAFCIVFSGLLFASAADNPSPAKLTVEPGHAWTPPFGVERVGWPLEAVVEVPGGAKPADEYVVVGYRDGKEISRQSVNFLDEFLFGHAETRTKYRWGRVALTDWPSEVALLVKTENQASPVEMARGEVKPPSFEADAVARPDKPTNPVDLGAILPPADWLLLSGGQRAEVEVAALNRGNDVTGATAIAWYDSMPDRKVQAALALSQNCKAQVKLGLGACSQTLTKDTLHVAIVDGAGKEIWRKDIRAMLVPEPPKWPSFGAVETKLRYDERIPVPGGMTIDYNEGWDPKLHDVVVCLPNGARFVFWRGASYCPFWAGRDNTGYSYEFAERGSTPGGEALADRELRYGRVEIVESSAARVHVRWRYRGVYNENYDVNGDLPVEDFYFYPDGFGVRTLTLTCAPQAAYELNEFIVFTPMAGYPLEMLPDNMLDILWVGGGKAEFSFPYFPGRQESESAKVLARTQRVPSSAPYSPTIQWSPSQKMPIYRVRFDRSKELAAIQYNPRGGGPTCPGDFLQDLFGPQYERGAIITRSYWANHWPLNRAGGGCAWTAGSRPSPGHNSFLSTGVTATEASPYPAPLRREKLRVRDDLGQLTPMRQDTFAWLIGMTDASDDQLRQWAQSFTQPPVIQVQGAELDAKSYYAQDRRALCLTMDEARHSIEMTITPAGRCVNPVFELKNAPKTLKSVKLGDQTLDRKQYAWDGATLWLDANFAQPATLKLEFAP